MFNVPRPWTTRLIGGVSGLLVGLGAAVCYGVYLGVWFGAGAIFVFGVGLNYGLVGLATAALLRRRLLRAPPDAHPLLVCVCLGVVYAVVVAGIMVLLGCLAIAALQCLSERSLEPVVGPVLRDAVPVLSVAEPVALLCGLVVGSWIGIRTRPSKREQGDWFHRAGYGKK